MRCRGGRPGRMPGEMGGETAVGDGRGRYRSGDRPDEDYRARRGLRSRWPVRDLRPRRARPGRGLVVPRATFPAPGLEADVPDRSHGRRSGRTGTAEPGRAGPRRTSGRPGRRRPGPRPRSPSSARRPARADRRRATTARPYGRILIFTLLDDRVADFDRLAEETAEQIRTGEPDTLVYVIHLVPNAPLQRIFYEIYRDRAAFDSHEGQPYMQRFVAERRSCVLATNVIELRLKYAKVAPLPPGPAAAAPLSPLPLPLPPLPPAASAPLPGGPPQRPQPLPAGPPPGARGPQVPQRLQPLSPAPPARPQRPDQQRYDQQRYDQRRPDQERYDQERYDQRGPDQRGPDQRQLPSAGRRYGG